MEHVDSIQPGDHVALFFRTRAEQFSWVCPFVASGLQRNERVLYIAHDNSVPMVLSKFERFGIDVNTARATDALRVVTRNESYQKHGIFEPQKMVDSLVAQVDHALADGFSGLRASGEMTWAIDTPHALAQLTGYEAGLHENFAAKLTGLCQYDVTRFAPSVVSDMIRIHPKIIANGRLSENPLHAKPQEVLSGTLPEVSLNHLFSDGPADNL